MTPTHNGIQQVSAPVARWAFDAQAGQIHGIDQHGRVLMFVITSPLFAHRLATAFGLRATDRRSSDWAPQVRESAPAVAEACAA